ncbi:GNAT family N-acetyltransferase [Pseudomonas sp. 148P]|uniref:GNAT family N-acetyltransferase n=1 Tax=Pseudomonas ulcerans TaxID=3115852 RepID=A0ABU7HTH8_9PSED|nr:MULTISPECIES: GNAT family N-acetyltransferase [unclassified Pseudomonas]MEE1923276.1 GNAT family N-acetyltransferase [Pseudomonas sp. 147P]MEE1934849.1 GNAT family N-acetyltransferase [Pseudomonas sp. 148P]
MSKYAVTLRALETTDMAFSEHVYATSRADEMSHSGWPASEIAAFLKMQFNAQHTYYQEHFRGGDFLIVELDGQPIGRLYLYAGETTLTIIDIALLPEFQGQGIGTDLIHQQLQRADDLGLAVELSVETYNRAQRLYARAGFHVINESGVYLRMRREALDPSRRMAS